jgi:hypothetical protein
MDEAIANLPLPAQLSIIGALILWNILTLRAQNTRVQKGELVPKVTVDEMLRARDEKYDDMLGLRAEQVAAAVGVKDEWKTAHTVSEAARKEERVTTASAVEGSRAIEHFLTSVVPKVESVTTSGDNGPKEARRR